MSDMCSFALVDPICPRCFAGFWTTWLGVDLTPSALRSVSTTSSVSFGCVFFLKRWLCVFRSRPSVISLQPISIHSRRHLLVSEGMRCSGILFLYVNFLCQAACSQASNCNLDLIGLSYLQVSSSHIHGRAVVCSPASCVGTPECR